MLLSKPFYSNPSTPTLQAAQTNMEKKKEKTEMKHHDVLNYMICDKKICINI